MVHRVFRDIGQYLRGGDLLVLNQSRVIPARLFGEKVETGGRVELLLLNRRDELTWEALTRGKRLRPGTQVLLQAPGVEGEASDVKRQVWHVLAEIVGETESRGRLVRFEQPVEPLLDELGVVPLPPYIHEPLADPERYQTVYGQVEGSVASSTAGLHFTPELLLSLRRMGVELAFITLHIGLDTFRPVKEEQVEDHQIHSEWYELTASAAQQINQARLEGRRVVAAGTTVVRALESAARAGTAPTGSDCAPKGSSGEQEGSACAWQTVRPYAGPTELFIYPGFRFRVVEAMITNFHLPRSSLLMLVSAFAGRELILAAYREAIARGYRFFSFGDAMLLL
jgi:S-adenosylmethionine:tRNA ribosyltransferase-isomerase